MHCNMVKLNGIYHLNTHKPYYILKLFPSTLGMFVDSFRSIQEFFVNYDTFFEYFLCYKNRYLIEKYYM